MVLSYKFVNKIGRVIAANVQGLLPPHKAGQAVAHIEFSECSGRGVTCLPAGRLSREPRSFGGAEPWQQTGVSRSFFKVAIQNIFPLVFGIAFD
jgi:hypothetical protein